MTRKRAKSAQPDAPTPALDPPPPAAPLVPAAPEPKPGALRNRVIERRRMLGSDLVPNAKNWRIHTPEQTAALNEILTTIGMAGELLAYTSVRNGGKLTTINGHLRSAKWADELWDVAITDLDDAEADKLLAAMDPIGDAAEVDQEKLRALMAEIDMECAELEEILKETAHIKPTRAVAARKARLIIPPEIEAAIGAYCRRQEVAPNEDDVIIFALKKFLIQSGDLKQPEN